jgi:uncharacterized coiled-coil protein SlyX
MLDTLDEHTFDNRFAADSKLYVVFHMEAIQNGFRTEQEGRPIFDDVPHVRIHVPGDKTSVVDRPVIEEDKQRFSAQWEKFQKGMTQSPDGTPIEQWPLLTIGQVHEFKALNVMTVEQLAGMADANAQRFMGGNELRRKAKAFLAVAKDSAEAQRLVSANAELESRLATQDQTIAHLMTRLEAMEDKRKAKA